MNSNGNDSLARLLANVGTVPTADDIAADARDRAVARVDRATAVLAGARRDYGYNSARTDSAARALFAARRAAR